MTQQKKSMDKMTKGFIIFMAAAFVILSVVAVFGNRSYELKGLAKTGQPQQSQNAGTSGSGSPEFQPYLEEIHKQISGKWQPPAVNKDSEVVLKFTVLKNGHVINEQVSQSSGIKEVDESGHFKHVLDVVVQALEGDGVAVRLGFLEDAEQYAQSTRSDVFKFLAVNHDVLVFVVVERFHLLLHFDCGGSVELALKRGN